MLRGISREQLINLLRRIEEPSVSDDTLNACVDEIARRTSCPTVTDLMFHQSPELSLEEIADRLINYHSIAMPGPERT